MTRPFPKLLLWFGLPITLLSVVLAARLVWEQTVWTWEQGPQMVGFSMIHQGWGILLLLAFWAGWLWLAAVVIFALLRRSIGGWPGATLTWAYVVALGVVLTPYGVWQRLFVERLAHSPKAADFVQYAAALGDLATVKAFLAQGLPVDVRDRHGATPLHAAAVGGQLAVAEYLVSHGADVNAINKFGDSPLENAESENRQEVAAFLKARGAKRVRGTAETRDKVISDILRQDSEALDRRLKEGGR